MPNIQAKVGYSTVTYCTVALHRYIRIENRPLSAEVSKVPRFSSGSALLHTSQQHSVFDHRVTYPLSTVFLALDAAAIVQY